MSFWKKTDVSSEGDKQKTRSDRPIIQLEVDVYRESDRLIIFAPLPGVDIGDVNIAVEGETDIIVISGHQARPPKPPRKGRRSGAFVTEECVWGEFYRRIILPASIDIDATEAKLHRGVLVLTLPLQSE